jgi:hypothetical protein
MKERYSNKNERTDEEKESIHRNERIQENEKKKNGDIYALSNSCGMFMLLLPLDLQLVNSNFWVTTRKTMTKQVSFMCFSLLTQHIPKLSSISELQVYNQ